MAGSVNKAILIGNLGKDPEIRHTQDGKVIASFSLATSESWKDKATGERREATQWHKVVIFNEGLAKIAEQYLKKGSTVYIEGQIQTRKYTDKDGIEKYTTEIVLQNYGGTLTMVGGKADQDATDAASSARPAAKTSATRQSFARDLDLDDDVPF